MSPYRRSADIAGTSQTGQLHGLDPLTFDPSTDTYNRVKAVRERSELIVQGAASGSNRAYTGQLTTFARQLYRALPKPQQQVLDNAQAQGQVNYKQDDQVADVEQIIRLFGKEPLMSLVSRLIKTLNDSINCKRGTAVLCVAREENCLAIICRRFSCNFLRASKI
jgi:hypothetical protein